MRSPIFLLLMVLAGCTSETALHKTSIERLLAKGDYRQAITEIEHGPRSAEWRFFLGLLYAYREIEERGEKADFTEAIAEIRAAMPENEEARWLIADYEQRGAQVFFAFPWAHLIGPFPEKRRPQPAEARIQPPAPTSGLAPGRGSS
jgi:hypothetical protein